MQKSEIPKMHHYARFSQIGSHICENVMKCNIPCVVYNIILSTLVAPKQCVYVMHDAYV